MNEHIFGKNESWSIKKSPRDNVAAQSDSRNRAAIHEPKALKEIIYA